MSRLVSVVLPTRNRVAVLDRAIRSVLGQTYGDLELIVVDDGSNDGSAEVVHAVRDARVQYLPKAVGEGVARARNEGVLAARGELIAFQDSDDEWLATKLELQVALLEVSPPDVGWVGGSYIADGGALVESPRLVAGEDYDVDLLLGDPFVTPTWLVRRSVLLDAGLFDPRFPSLEDWDLIFRLADLCRFRAVAAPIMVKHASADSLYADPHARAAALDLILADHRDRWLAQPALYAYMYRDLARLHAIGGERRAAVRALRQALRHQPSNPRTYALGAALARPALVRRLTRAWPEPAKATYVEGLS